MFGEIANFVAADLCRVNNASALYTLVVAW